MEESNLWFKAKRYGYGWYPATWQGWGVLLMYVFAVYTDFLSMHGSCSVSDVLIGWFPRLFILTVFLIIICETKGEKAKWRWGKK